MPRLATTPLLLLQLLLLAYPAIAHKGCGRASVAQRERESIRRSVLMNAYQAAKESAATARAPAPPPLPPAPPRIWLDFRLDGWADDDGMRAQIESDTMPTAVRVLRKLFQVRRPTPGNLLLPSGWASKTCLDAAVDPEFVSGSGQGRPVDFVLYVTSAPCAAGTVAYAGACAVGGEDSRPVMGSINLCPGAYDVLTPRRQMEVIVHELLHALVSAPAAPAPAPHHGRRLR
jgi:hypothetical protein